MCSVNKNRDKIITINNSFRKEKNESMQYSLTHRNSEILLSRYEKVTQPWEEEMLLDQNLISLPRRISSAYFFFGIFICILDKLFHFLVFYLDYI